MIFTELMNSDSMDLDTKEGRARADVLSKIISRARAADDRFAKLETELSALREERQKALTMLEDSTVPMAERAQSMRALFGLSSFAAIAAAVALLLFQPTTVNAMKSTDRMEELRAMLAQSIPAALQQPDSVSSMDDETLERLAMANVPGTNHNGWQNPFPADQPFSLLKEYQFRYMMDSSRFKAGLWGRQTGKDFTTEGEAVMDCLLRPGTEWMVAAPSERQSLDSLDKARAWAQAFDLIIADYQERREGSSSQTLLKSAEIKFSNGSKIVAVPGKPDTVRGKSANILLTEFDFFEDPAATWRAILPSITNPLKGGEKRVRLVTTPNGVGSAMHKLWLRDDKKIKWARHLVTVYHAVLYGMPIDVESLREAFGDDLEGFLQECLCRFLDASANLLPYELIASCESGEASEFDTPEAIAQSPLRKVAGVDFGRVNDPTVMCLGLQGLGTSIVRNITRLKGMSTPEQVRTLKPYLELCDRICVDYTGPGIGFGDDLVELFGEYNPAEHKNGKVELCTFTASLKRELFPNLRSAFEKRRVLVPVSTWLREDLHAMVMVINGGNFSYKAPRSDEGHSDGCTALSLMNRAAASLAGSGGHARSIAASSEPQAGLLTRAFRTLNPFGNRA